MRKLLSAIALIGALFVPVVSRADTFTFSAIGSGGGFSGTGSLVGTNNNNGSFTITAISGTGITGLIGVGGFNGNDNLVFPGAALLVDGKGFAFTDIQGNTAFQVDIFSMAGGYAAFLKDSDGFTNTVPVTFTLTNTTTPEPSSLALLGTGVLGLAGVARRRFGRRG